MSAALRFANLSVDNAQTTSLCSLSLSVSHLLLFFFFLSGSFLLVSFFFFVYSFRPSILFAVLWTCLLFFGFSVFLWVPFFPLFLPVCVFLFTIRLLPVCIFSFLALFFSFPFSLSSVILFSFFPCVFYNLFPFLCQRPALSLFLSPGFLILSACIFSFLSVCLHVLHVFCSFFILYSNPEFLSFFMIFLSFYLSWNPQNEGMCLSLRQ